MNDEQAIIQRSSMLMAEVEALASEYTWATRLKRYQEGLCPETERRQKTDLALFAEFLRTLSTAPGDLYNDLTTWRSINAGLIETFLDWQKLQAMRLDQ